MRLYDITAGWKHYTSRNNPNALCVECDITSIDSDNFTSSSVRIWGISKEDISQATDLANKSFSMTAGMQQGLPLANAQASQAGVICKGYIYSAFGNRVGTDMTLDLRIFPGDPPDQPPPLNAPNPPPKNIILNWKKGAQLSDAVKQALQPAYPGQQLNINISPKLVGPRKTILAITRTCAS